MKSPGGRTMLWRDTEDATEFVIVAEDGQASHIYVRKDGGYTVAPGQTTVERVLAQGFSEEIPEGRMQMFLVIKAHRDWNGPIGTTE